METEGCVKGHQILLSKKYLTQKFGPQCFDTILEKMDSCDREILSKPIYTISWIPEETYAKFLASADTLFGQNYYQLCWEIGHYISRENIPKFFRFFIKFGDPAFVIRRAAQMWRQVHNNGNFEVKLTSPRSVLAYLRDKTFPHKAFCFSLMGYCQGVLELSGAKNVSIREVKCASEGGNVCVFEASWQ